MKEDSTKRAQKWQQRFTRCETDQEKMFKKVSNFYDIMYSVQKTDNIAPWRAKIYVPILGSKAWDLIARLSSVLPYFRTRINNEVELDIETGKMKIKDDVIARQKLLDSKLMHDYQYCEDEPMKLRVFDVMLDAVVAGTGFGKASWEYGAKKKYSREYDENGFPKDMGKEKVKTIKKGHNTFEPINFFNVFVANQSVSFAKSKYVIVRYFKSIDELKANDAYSNVDKLSTTTERGNFDIHNQSRNRLVNENKTDNNDETVPTATIFECYEKTPNGIQCSTYGVGKSDNGWVTLEAPSQKYWHDFYPVQPFYIRRKTYSPWGESLFENNSSLQYATNDLFNHYLDNWNLSIDSMILAEDGSLQSDFIIEPGGTITYTGEKPDAFKFPEPNPAQLSMVMNVIDKAVESATVPQYLSGVPNSSIDKTAGTATGITSISEAANEKIGYMKDNFKQSMVSIGKIWLSNLTQFQDQAEEIRTTEKGVETPGIVMPQDYDGDIDLTIDDDSLVPLSKDEKKNSLEALTSQAIMIQKAAIEQASVIGTKDFIPKINFNEILEEGVNYYAIKDPARFIIKDQELAQAQPTAPMGPDGQPLPPEQGLMPQDPMAGQPPELAQAQGQQGAAFGGFAQ